MSIVEQAGWYGQTPTENLIEAAEKRVAEGKAHKQNVVAATIKRVGDKVKETVSTKAHAGTA
jgi:hypothetical protein